jgi:hypothetical protein
MTELTTSQAWDLVLGGAVSPPVSGAVLGGVTGLNQRFEQPEQKLAALQDAVQYGMDALSLLQRGLEDADLRVRSQAYQSLQAIGFCSPEMERGIPLRVGDQIYSVYESSISYGDDWYYISSAVGEWYHEDFPLYKSGEDSSGIEFDYISDLPQDHQMHPSDAYENPSLVAHFIEQAAAQSKAQIVFQEKIGKLDCQIEMIERAYSSSEPEEDEIEDWEARRNAYRAAFNLRTWVETNGAVIDREVVEDWRDPEFEYEISVLRSLESQKRFDLMREIWQPLGYSALAFVHEYVIDRPCYLRLKAS